MPRLATIAHPALRALAESQRYAPKAATLRAVERIEAFAGEIDAAGDYPHEYVVFRVTGYRPSGTGIELINGRDLLSDLSALCETLSAHARLSESDLPPGVFTAEGLLDRWNISRRTLERDRRRGLVARRVRTDRGDERLAFSRAIVEAFEREHPERAAGGAGAPIRLSEAEREFILRRADRYSESLDMTRHAIAGRLAARLGRSTGAVRKVIDDQDGAVRPALDDRARRVLLAKWERGVPIAELASCAGRSRGAMHRLLLRERLLRLEAVGEPPASAKGSPDGDALASPVARTGLDIPVPMDPDAVVSLAEALSHAPPAEERALALAHRASWGRCAALVRTLERDAPPARLVDRAETDARWAGLLRERLSWCALPMVVRTIEERAGSALVEIPPMLAMHLVEEAMGEVVRASAGFDPGAGGRLSGRASLPVDRVIVRVLEGERSRLASGVASVRRTLTTGSWRARAHPGGGVLTPPGWLTRGLDRLSPDQRVLIHARFGYEGERPRTVGELAEERGTSQPGVWAALRGAVRIARGERAS
ncbi:MAG: hypothetical protein Tsb0013_01360 [Phycisphaerales bacterium]